MSSKTIEPSGNDKPVLLRAIEIILADPGTVREAALAVLGEFSKRYAEDRNPEDIEDATADKIISNYSYFAAFAGGATALTGVVPGLGTIIASFGGSTADIALTLKFQIEMTMAIATVYGHDITDDEEQRLCFLVAGLGVMSEASKKGAAAASTKAFIEIMRRYLKGTTLQAVRQVFKRIGVTFTRKAAEKAIPFGIGVIISFTVNKGLTWYVGTKAKAFFKIA
jgi:hypothetical protein